MGDNKHHLIELSVIIEEPNPRLGLEKNIDGILTAINELTDEWRVFSKVSVEVANAYEHTADPGLFRRAFDLSSLLALQVGNRFPEKVFADLTTAWSKETTANGMDISAVFEAWDTRQVRHGSTVGPRWSSGFGAWC